MADHEGDLKPGQKFPTPTPGFGDRVFYETLLRQRPDSFMAQEWCVNYGVLSYEEAEAMYEQVQERKRRMRAGGLPTSPIGKTTTKKQMMKKKQKTSQSSSSSSHGASKKVKIVKDEPVDTVLSGNDGIGRTTI